MEPLVAFKVDEEHIVFTEALQLKGGDSPLQC